MSNSPFLADPNQIDDNPGIGRSGLEEPEDKFIISDIGVLIKREKAYSSAFFGFLPRFRSLDRYA